MQAVQLLEDHRDDLESLQNMLRILAKGWPRPGLTRAPQWAGVDAAHVELAFQQEGNDSVKGPCGVG